MSVSPTGYCSKRYRKMIKPYFSFCLLLTLFALFVPCHGNEHDSLECEATGDCPDPIHTVMKLDKRDDELARRIARDHGLVVKVSLGASLYILKKSFSYEKFVLGTTIYG